MHNEQEPRSASIFLGQIERMIAAPKNSGDVATDVWKYLIYNRWSIHFMVILFGFLGLVSVKETVSADMEATISTSTLIVTGVLILVMVAVSIAVLELVPQLNTEPRKPLAPALSVAMLVMAMAWVSGLVLELTTDSVNASFVSVALSYLALLLSCWSIFPWLKHSWVWVAAAIAATVLFVHPLIGWYLFLSAIAIPMMRLFAWTFVVVKALQRARDSEAALQVTEERLRFSQQLHDTLGQHLAAISLKAQVAQALSARGDERLDDELKQLQSLAAQSTDGMRQVVRGYRSINLAVELRGAVELFQSAGITVEVHGISTDIPEEFRSVCAWLVREATTNVLRHSHASHVKIELSGTHLSVINDGVSETPSTLGGLETLCRQADHVGAQLETSTHKHGDAHTFTTECRFPLQLEGS